MEPYVGEIRIFAGTYAPQDWALCNGSLLQIQNYEALYSLIGTTYGGDGVNTFAVPNLLGRAALSVGQGPGLSNYTLGETVGADTVTITEATQPAHTHTFNATAAAANAPSPSGQLHAAASFGFYCPNTAPKINKLVLATTSITSTGGSQAHDNSMPSMALNYIISLTGLYPTTN